jgi:gluconolactonase
MTIGDQERWPGDPYEPLDDRFELCEADARLEQVFDGCRWAEGPVYIPSGRYLVFSDIPNNRLLRWDECTGATGVFRAPSRHANGATLDTEGRLIHCEQSGRRVVRIEHDGSLTVIAERYQGKRFNSPNDVVVKSDGSVWFTDPSYGIDSDYEGEYSESEIGACNVYRVDPADGSCRIVADDFLRPNGLAFSVDERRLFIADTRVNHIRSFAVSDAGELSDSAEFASCTNGRFDGFRFDQSGRIWAAAGDGVHCFDPAGALIGKIRIPEAAVSNVVFGGPKLNRLFICATTSVYSIHLRASGLPLSRA